MYIQEQPHLRPATADVVTALAHLLPRPAIS
ncbi:hypothetical protein LINPERPRIM_LOCUS37271 [Linum perenne]